MKLTPKQISKIDAKINLTDAKIMVMIDVSEDDDMSPMESSSNIYCIDQDNEIIWQVKEIKTKRPFDDDMFMYLTKTYSYPNKIELGEIYAVRFSGFEYKINPETGEAEQIGFRKA